MMKSVELTIEFTGELVKTGNDYSKYYLARFKNADRHLSYLTGVSETSFAEALVSLIKCVSRQMF